MDTGRVAYPGPSAYQHYLQAKQDENLERYANGADQLRLALAFDQNSPRLHFELGRMLLFAHQQQRAAEELKLSVELAPDWALPHFWLGELHFQQNDLDKAAESFKRALAIDPSMRRATKRIAELSYLLEGTRGMLNYLEKAVDRDPQDLDSWSALATLYHIEQEYEKLEGALVRLLELDPDNARAINKLSAWYDRTRRYDRAIAMFSRLEQILPPNTAVILQLGEFYLRAGDEGEAVRQFERARALDPSDPGIPLLIGFAYLDGKRYDLAAKEFERMVNNNGDPAARYLLGHSLMLKKDFPAALESFTKILDPGESHYLNAAVDTAHCLWALGKRKLADRQVEMLVDSQKSKIESYRLAANYYIKTKRLDKAVGVIEMGLERMADNPELLYLSAMLYEKMKLGEKAVSSIRSLLLLDPNHADALNFLGYHLAQEKDNLGEAERLIRRALQLKPDEGYIIDSLGWVYYQSGEIEQAIKWLSLASMIEPHDPEILLHLAQAYEKSGKYRQRLIELLRRAMPLVGEDYDLYLRYDKSFPELWLRVREESENGGDQ